MYNRDLIELLQDNRGSLKVQVLIRVRNADGTLDDDKSSRYEIAEVVRDGVNLVIAVGR